MKARYVVLFKNVDESLNTFTASDIRELRRRLNEIGPAAILSVWKGRLIETSFKPQVVV